ncbi:MAG TPA: hypoxanthine phosphoribosyltransferase [Chloroflexota bacterium]|nr:hypoxanthine phosphoribosyltransferase [Chloroflexota bacterium]HEX2988081.1 hypoxanthine phosphoribosyltransferase [Chloroflexota bacterium]
MSIHLLKPVASTRYPKGSVHHAGIKFVHPSEAEFARILDFYRIKWIYEPKSFPLRWDGDRVTEMFTPDFYLPGLDTYVELTTMKQSLVTKKNRKLRELRELYPEVNIRLLYRRDYQSLLAKYGYRAITPTSLEDIDHVLLSADEIQKRVDELAEEINRDYAGQELRLVGILKGVAPFMTDLMRKLTMPVSVDYMFISKYIRDGSESEFVRILKDLDNPIEGTHLLLVEDIVDTGFTLRYILNYLRARKPASLKVCTLLDKRARRLVDQPLDYVAFEIPDEYVVGYGLDHRELYRNLPFVCVLKPEAYRL